MLLSLPILVEELCDDFECLLLFREPDCDGPDSCPQKKAMMEGISIYAVFGDDAQYVATISKTKH